MKYSKAQIQILENAFVLIVVFIILIIAILFIAIIQKSDQAVKNREYKELDAAKKSQLLAFLPELQCSHNNNLEPDCFDQLKIQAFSSNIALYGIYYKSLLGNIRITVKRYDISTDTWQETWTIYDYPRQVNNGIREFRYPVLLADPVDKSNYFGILYLGVYQ